MLLPILVVWGVSFRAFDLYRPRRIASHLSEAADLAKASSLGALVLVAVMTFLFREYEYSRVVIVYFWLLSIGAVWLARGHIPRGAPLRPAPRLQPALRRGGRRRRPRRHRGEPVGGADRRGDRGAGRRRRRQGGHGRGAPARRLLGSAGRSRRSRGGPCHPRPRARGLRASRWAARGGGRRAGDHPRRARSLPLRVAARRRGGVRGHAVHSSARLAAARLEPGDQARPSTSCSRARS